MGNITSLWDIKKEGSDLAFGSYKEGKYEEIINDLLAELKREQERRAYLEGLMFQHSQSIMVIVDKIKSEFEKIDGVESMYFENDNIIRLVTVVKEINDDIEDAIYSKEYDILNAFPQVKIDFVLLPKSCESELKKGVKRIL